MSPWVVIFVKALCKRDKLRDSVTPQIFAHYLHSQLKLLYFVIYDLKIWKWILRINCRGNFFLLYCHLHLIIDTPLDVTLLNLRAKYIVTKVLRHYDVIQTLLEKLHNAKSCGISEFPEEYSEVFRTSKIALAIDSIARNYWCERPCDNAVLRQRYLYLYFK